MKKKYSTETKIKEKFYELVMIIKKLTGPEGCPWDIKQNHKSLAPQLLEETYELFEAIDNENIEGILEELGDILLQIVFHSEILKKSSQFDISDVCNRISKKMIGRHPHVFEKGIDHGIKSDIDVEKKWEYFKRKESIGFRSIVSSIPKSMPALAFSTEIQKRALKSGIPLNKLYEVDGDVNKDIQAGKKLLMLTREIFELGLDPEMLLKTETVKLRDRIISTEKKTEIPLDELSKEKLEELWDSEK